MARRISRGSLTRKLESAAELAALSARVESLERQLAEMRSNLSGREPGRAASAASSRLRLPALKAPDRADLAETTSQRHRVARKPDRLAALQPDRDCGAAGGDHSVSEVGDR